jgi:hypothetical protein
VFRPGRRFCLIAKISLDALALSPPAHADCTPPSHVSTCIDADTFWPHAGSGPFAIVGSAETLAPGAVGVGFVATYLARPIVLQVPSADPAGAEFRAVGSVWDATLLGALGLGSGFEAELALPMALYRSGTGVSALTDQQPTALAHWAMRDVRLGAALQLVHGPPDPMTYGLLGRVELALPTGDEASFSGDGSVVLIPSIAGRLRDGRFFGGAELGARLRGVNELAGTRVGSQLLIALGAGAALLPEERLSLALEAIALPSTLAQQQVAFVYADGQRQVVGTGPALVPAEWLASVRTAGLVRNWSASVGAGGALELFGAGDMTAPSFRFMLSLAYAPRPSEPSSASRTSVAPHRSGDGNSTE